MPEVLLPLPLLLLLLLLWKESRQCPWLPTMPVALLLLQLKCLPTICHLEGSAP